VYHFRIRAQTQRAECLIQIPPGKSRKRKTDEHEHDDEDDLVADFGVSSVERFAAL
jgi:hypothetical protein